MRPAPAILLIDADPHAAEQLAQQLAADGYRVDVARTTEHARMLAREHPPELALLGDLGEPHATLALLEEIRGRSLDGAAPWDLGLPALVLGSGVDRLDAIRAFEAGADDYLPAGAYLELRARVGALLRRAGSQREPAVRVRVGELEIDARSRCASLASEPLDLRRLEFDLLLHMAREPTRVFERRELLRSVWGYGNGCSTRTVDSHASRLRRKLDPQRAGTWVLGVRGVGYRLR